MENQGEQTREQKFLAALNGEAGEELQVHVLTEVIERHVESVFAQFRVLGTGGVKVHSMPGQHVLFQTGRGN